MLNNKRYKLIFDVDNNHAIFVGGNGETHVEKIPSTAISNIQGEQTTLKIPITATTFTQIPSKPIVMGQTTQIIPITDSDVASDKRKTLPISATASAQVPTQSSVQSHTTTKVTKEITKLPNYGKEISMDLTKKPKDEALIDIEKLKNVSGKPRVEIPKRSGYKKFLKWAFRGFKVVAGAAAMVVSFGAAGDTLTDTTFLIIDVVFLVSNVASILILSTSEASATKWIKDIYYLEWKGNPALVKSDMNIIFDEVEQNENASELYGVICEKYLSILDSFAAMFGSLISAMIPDDAGATRIVVELIISEGMIFMGKVPFMALSFIYNTIPTILQEVLKNQKNLSKFFLDMLAYLKGLLPNENDTAYQRAKKHFARGGIINVLCPIIPFCAPLMPVLMTGNILVESNLVSGEVAKFIDNMIAPHTDSYAALIMRILPLVFATTLIFSRCTGSPEPEPVPVAKVVSTQPVQQGGSKNKLQMKVQSGMPILNEEKCSVQYGGMSQCIRKKINLYNVLGISRDADKNTLQKAYQNNSVSNINKHSNLVMKTAYDILNNKKEKELYDAALILDNPNKWWPTSHAEFEQWKNIN